jgi:hypothetical protein
VTVLTVQPKAASPTDAEPGRPARRKSEVRRRSQVVTVRLTDDEKARFTALATRRGFGSLPELMRLLCEAALLQEMTRDHRD